MRLEWHLSGNYEEVGGDQVLREAMLEAFAVLPREHLRQLGGMIIQDSDPKGKALGLWRQDHTGCAIEMYARPHVETILPLRGPTRDFALRLHLAYTLFHEVGHHVTRVLNRRAAPPRKPARVEEKIERWADEYAEKRLAKLCAHWLRPEGRAAAPEARRALTLALRALRFDDIAASLTGTSSVEASS